MILVFYGTKEARDLIKELKNNNFSVYAAVVTDYGKELALEGGAEEVFTGRLKEEEILKIVEDKKIKVIIDGAHPFSEEISFLAQKICKDFKLLYIRFERREGHYPESSFIHQVASIEEAAKKACELGKVIFVTTGSHNLDKFLPIAKEQKKRVVVRVIPEEKVIKKCRELGLAPKDIIAMQGPFSIKTNKALFQAVRAEVLVTKDSGEGGGTDTKIAAALALKMPVVLLARKANTFPNKVYSPQEVLERIKAITY